MAASTTQSLSTLISTIPVAVEGELITSDYHNSLRALVLAMVDLLGSGAIQRTFSFLPTFFKNGTFLEWRFTNGIASAPAQQNNSVSGILPIQLPNGVTVKRVIVRGRKLGAVDKWVVRLMRQAIEGNTPSPLITVSMMEVTADDRGFFSQPGVVTLPPEIEVRAGVSGILLQDLRTVDTDAYKYFISAQADGVADLAEIHTIQIECSQ